MKIYLIETGQMCQGGTIVEAYTKFEDCLHDFKHLQTVEEQKAYNTVTVGLSEYDKTPGTVCGFWAGPTNGNTHAHGWRVRIIEAKEEPWF